MNKFDCETGQLYSLTAPAELHFLTSSCLQTGSYNTEVIPAARELISKWGQFGTGSEGLSAADGHVFSEVLGQDETEMNDVCL